MHLFTTKTEGGNTMDLGLKDKVTIVTGGGQGIGRVIAKAFAAEGAKVVVGDINSEGADKVVKEIEAMGGQALAVQSDVTKLEGTDSLAKGALEKFGGIDVLVHCAAAFSVATFMNTPPEKWDMILGVSQRGALNCTRSVLPKMQEQKSGRIIFIGSDAGRVGDAYQPVYSSAKGGVVAFAKSIAQEVGGSGVTVNVVCPGLVVTEENKQALSTMYGLDDEKKAKRILSLYPLRRLGTPEDVANMVVFLSSERGGYVTGQTISVDGGYCML
jgi:2-hydroxycyclohexanecarboxyl-CoA dehydrogenase